MRTITLFILGALLLSSCSNTSSDNVRTTGFYVTVAVNSSDGVNATATARIQVGGSTGTYVELEEQTDSILVNGQGLNKSEAAGIITYSASVPYEAGGIYEFVITRADEGSYTSTVTLPEAFTLTAPAQGATLAPNSTTTVSWAATGNDDEIDISLKANYLQSNSTTNELSTSYSSGSVTSDDASYSFSSSETAWTTDETSYTGSVSVTRTRTGTVDSTFEGGSASGTQTRTNTFTWSE
jgi:hypothetical protein